MQENSEARATSMFAFRENSRIEYDTKYDNHKAGVKNLLVKGVLKSQDKQILNFLEKYVFLNAYMIRCLMAGDEKAMGIDRVDMQKTLKMLTKTGLIRRFKLVYVDDFGEEHKTPFVYQLGTIDSMYADSTRANLLQDFVTFEEVTKRLALNQFYITFIFQYAYKNFTQRLTYGGKYADCIITPISASAGQKIHCNVLALRKHNKWKTEIKERLNARTNGFMTVIITETEQFAMEVERFRMSQERINQYSILYICDYAAISGELLFDQLILVNPENNYSSYDICKFEIKNRE